MSGRGKGDRLRGILDRGDPTELIAAALNAWFSDEVCDCAEPILTGLDLMCGRCLLENEGQIEKRTTAHNSPHPFQRHDRVEWMCGFCSRSEDDSLHAEAAPQDPQERDA